MRRRTGRWLAAAAAFAVGLVIGALLYHLLAQDSCLDHGGAWRGWYCELEV